MLLWKSYRIVIETINIMGCILAQNSQIHTLQLQGKKTGFDTSKNLEGEVAERVKRLSIEPSPQDIELLDKVLSQHFFLYKLPKSQRTKFIDKMDIYECERDTVIFNKGEIATLFFVIISGKVQIITPNPQQDKKNEEKIILQKGCSFGDLALLFTAKRSATAVALTKCYFFCVSNLTFRKTVQQISRRNYEIAKAFIYKTSVFAYLSKYEKNAIAYNTLFLRFEKGQTIFTEGQEANSFYIITSGRIELRISGKSPFEMKSGDSFGQNAFSCNQKRLGTAIALQVTSLLSISRQSLLNCLGSHLQDISFYNILKWAFNRNEHLQSITNAQKERLINLVELKEYGNQEIVCKEGDKIEGLMFVLQEKINDLGVGQVFHDQEYFKTEQYEIEIISRQTLIKNGAGSIAVLRFEHLDVILSKKNYKSTKQINSNETETQRKERIEKLKLSQLQGIQQICCKEFYEIYLAADCSQRKYFVKCIPKAKIKSKSIRQFIERQRVIAKELLYKFIPPFTKEFEDSHFNFLLFQHRESCSFSDIIKQMRKFSKKKTQFYTACLILILEYFHENLIIYRDLKPENILLDESGFLQIYDLTTAKHLYQESGFRTYTVVGTPHYMAPEVFSVQGYSFSSDIWSLGIIFYQMISGKLPFGNDIEDPFQIIKEIQQKDVKVPTDCEDQATKQLIMKLLQKNPGERLVQGVGKLKSHNFFQKFDWDGLQKKRIEVPYKGGVSKKNKNKTINKNLVRYLHSQLLDNKQNN